MVKVVFSVKKFDDSIKEALHKAIDSDDCLLLEKLNNKYKDIVAIGEIKDDEQFLFYNNNFKYYQPTVESINNFITKEDRYLILLNEKVDSNTLWNIVKEHSSLETMHTKLAKLDKSELDLYAADDVESYASKDWLKKYNPEFGEFFNDNLRFCSFI